MITNSYTRSHFDYFVYFENFKDGFFIYLFLYVDNMLITSNNKVEVEELKVKLRSKFEIKDLGGQKTLGMWNVLSKFGIGISAKLVATPLSPL